jgi:flagellar biosynthesis protein FlhG
MDQRNEKGIRTPIDLLNEIQALDPVEGTRFVATIRAFRPKLVVNEVRTADDVKLGFSMSSVCKKYFGFEPEYLGYVNYDELARRSVGLRRPVVDVSEEADASIYLQRIARKLLAIREREQQAADPTGPGRTPDQ